jgi:hypothetical protein
VHHPQGCSESFGCVLESIRRRNGQPEVDFQSARKVQERLFFKKPKSPAEPDKNLVDREGLEPSTN